MSPVAVFRRLAAVTAVFAYLQIALGGVVRVSGSGLGCPDWPLCHGRPYPPADIHAIVEYSHRTVGAITGVLIIASVIGAWLVWRTRRPLVAWIATAALVAIAAEGALGGIVVVQELQPWLVAFHLGLAMIILGALIATAVMAAADSPGVAGPRLRGLAWGAMGATYVLLLTGSAVVASGADESCHSFPLCGGGFALDFTGASAYTMLHRGAVLVIGALLAYLLVQATGEPALRPVALATLLVLAAQVLAGAGSALTNTALANGAHVALATLVWSGVLIIALLTLPRADHLTIQLRVERHPT